MQVLLLAISKYQAQNGQRPYSPDGSDEALKLLIEAGLLDEPGAVQDDDGRFIYLYLNPEPGTDLAADTIILVDREIHRCEDHSGLLLVATLDGKRHTLDDLSSGTAEEFLGKQLSELAEVTGEDQNP